MADSGPTAPPTPPTYIGSAQNVNMNVVNPAPSNTLPPANGGLRDILRSELKQTELRIMGWLIAGGMTGNLITAIVDMLNGP